MDGSPLVSRDGRIAKLKLLIADDDVEVQKALKRAAEHAGYEVQQAFEGTAVLDMARAKAPDLILLDIVMPGADGWTVLRALKVDPATVGIPVLICSGQTDQSDRRLGLELGAEDYVDKPFVLERLMNKVAWLIDLARLKDRNASEQKS